MSNVKTQAFGWDKAQGEFPSVQSDMHLGINSVQVVEHPHVQLKVAHGNVPVFRHNQVQPDHTRINRSKLEASENLRKYLLRRKPSQYLIKIAKRDVACGESGRRAAFKLFFNNRRF